MLPSHLRQENNLRIVTPVNLEDLDCISRAEKDPKRFFKKKKMRFCLVMMDMEVWNGMGWVGLDWVVLSWVGLD